MSFIRVKEIGKKGGKKYKYAYLVENRWRKRLKGGKKGSRQKVSKYLGKVVRLDVKREAEFFKLMKIQDIEKYLQNKKRRIVLDLVRFELLVRGFQDQGGVLVRDGIMFDGRFVDLNGEEQRIVIEMNEGFLCNYTIQRLLHFRSLEDERETGVRLAKAFLEAGLRVPKEIFVGYFEKIQS